MKKQLSKITLKTDKIVSLSKQRAQQIEGGAGIRTMNSKPAVCSTG